MITHILVPHDASPSATAALALAADLASKSSAKLTLLHVGFRDGVPEKLAKKAEAAVAEAKAAGKPISAHPEWSPHHQALELLGQTLLAEAKAEAERRGAAKVETVLDFGDGAERILHHARHRGIDLIVMGSRGHSKFQGLMLGSVSQKVQHLAPCTTIMVRERDERPIEQVASILAATDGSEHARKACDLATEIASKAGARLILVHIPLKDATPELIKTLVDPAGLSASAREDLRLGSLPLPIISDRTLAEVGQALLAQARKEAEAKGVASVETMLEKGDPAQTILDLAKARHVDLIVMGSRGVGIIEGLLLGSASNKVSHLAECPVVVVR